VRTLSHESLPARTLLLLSGTKALTLETTLPRNYS
jgi:hypothetical protein